VVHQHLHDFVAPLHGGAHQRRPTVFVGAVRIEAEIQQQLHRLDVLLGGTLVRHAFDPADARGGSQRGVAEIADELRIGPVGEQQPHQRGVARLGGAHEGRDPGLLEPLHREDRPGQRVLFGARVRIGAMVQQDLDVVEVIHVRLGHRIITAFDVAVVGGKVQRRPPALVGEIHIGAPINQHRRQPVMAVVGRRQQRRPAVLGDLIDVGPGVEQQVRRLEIALTRREHERRQAAAAAPHQSSHDDFGVVGGIFRRDGCGRCRAGDGWCRAGDGWCRAGNGW
jgi:hypothetical protein